MTPDDRLTSENFGDYLAGCAFFVVALAAAVLLYVAYLAWRVWR